MTNATPWATMSEQKDISLGRAQRPSALPTPCMDRHNWWSASTTFTMARGTLQTCAANAVRPSKAVSGAVSSTW